MHDFLPTTAVPLVEIRRGARTESIHFGWVAVCDAAGKVIHACGNPSHPVYLRSAAKPFQTIALLQLGAAERWGWTPEEIAVITGSHGAQPVHLQAVRSILHKAGITEEQLACGPHDPMHRVSAHELVRLGQRPGPIHNNCSGKHAGMLAACVHKGWPLETYLERGHPVQWANAIALGWFTGFPGDEIPVGVDGCGVPSFFLPLASLAMAFARLATPGTRPKDTEVLADRVVSAMCDHPVQVSYEGDFTARLLSGLGSQVVAKGAAEGVFGVGLRGQGIGIAVKISDGSQRPIPAVIVELLQRFLPNAQLDDLRNSALMPQTNTRNEVVGEVRISGW